MCSRRTCNKLTRARQRASFQPNQQQERHQPIKAAARAAVINDLGAINFGARALAVTTPGLEDKFRLPRKANEQAVLASARAFASDAAPLKDKFIALEMPANFLEDLAADIAELEATLSRRRNTRTSQVKATASMEAALTEALEILQ